jgi:hypothetical protein
MAGRQAVGGHFARMGLRGRGRVSQPSYSGVCAAVDNGERCKHRREHSLTPFPCLESYCALGTQPVRTKADLMHACY